MTGTANPVPGTNYPVIAVDFGTGDALAIHGSGGPIKPRRGGVSSADKFVRVLPWLLEQAHVVVESPTVGSSGAEPEAVRAIVDAAPHRLFVLSARAVKNWRKDLGETGTVHPDEPSGTHDPVSLKSHTADAALIYHIATTRPARLREWRYVPAGEKLVRRHKSVRPHDKRNYRGADVDALIGRAHRPGHILPRALCEAFCTTTGDLSRAMLLPFCQAMDEPGANTRDGYERILGLYDHGYPSYYRRKTIDLMQDNAKRLAGVDRMEQVTPERRKEAWRITRRQIRALYQHLKAGTRNPDCESGNSISRHQGCTCLICHPKRASA